MKKYTKIMALLLAVALLSGCTGQTPEATQTQPTETEPAPEPITTESALVAALEDQVRVTLEGDITLTKGVVVKDNLLDGGGHTVTAPVYDENDPATSCGILVERGTVENVTVKGGYRGVGTNSEHKTLGEVRLNKVVADGENCALYIGNGSGSGSLLASNCSFGGQTVFNRITHAQFENCTFTWNESGSKGNLTAYANVTLIGCRFEGKEDGTKYTLQFSGSVDGCLMILEDCYVGDTLITQENIGQLLKANARKNKIEIRNTIK